jgi:hypothetical protein
MAKRAVAKKGCRTCRRCGEEKPSAEFYETHLKRPRRVCQACRGRANEAREKQIERWQAHGRKCSRCGEQRQCPNEIGIAQNSICKTCTRRRQAAWKREHYDSGQNIMATQKWRRRNPEAYEAAWRRYEAKRRRRLAIDPEYREAFIEAKRMRERLWRERNGVSLRVADGVVTTGGAEVPIDPLLREIEKLRKRLGVTVDKGQHESDFESFCESLGVSDRTIRDWRAGNRSMVRMATVDRILTNTDWHWWDVWGPDDPGYEKVRQAFEGDEEEIAA